MNRAWLARILRFYASKGLRHGLDDTAYQNAMREIDRMVRERAELPDLTDLDRVGYLFCPEYGGREPDRIEHAGEAELWLFGPNILPEPRGVVSRGEETSAPNRGTPIASTDTADSEATPTPEAIDRTMGETTDRAAFPETGKQAQEGASILLGRRDSSDDPVIWQASIKANPHMMILGLPGMGKTTCLINICEQLQSRGISPIVFSYHQDIDEKLAASLPEPPLMVRYSGLGFNPMEVNGDGTLAYLDNVGMLRDIFAAIFPDLGDIQLGRLREALKQSYLDQGWGPGQPGEVPEFHAFLDLLRNDCKPDKGLLTRLAELDDYGLFDAGSGALSLLDAPRPALIQIHGTQNEYLQRAFATFVLYNLYQNMFRRGPQGRITHAIIFDEAHRAARLKLIPTMVKECRKYGIAFVVASQEAKDFDPSLFTAVANYLALRLNETDARLMARNFAATDKVSLYADRIKQMPKYRAMYYAEGMRTPVVATLVEHL